MRLLFKLMLHLILVLQVFLNQLVDLTGLLGVRLLAVVGQSVVVIIRLVQSEVAIHVILTGHFLRLKRFRNCFKFFKSAPLI